MGATSMIWWLPLVLAAPMFLIWTTIHEGSHALAARLTGAEIRTFKPWPHRFEGRWYFGRMSYEPSSSKGLGLIVVFPYVVDVVVFSGLTAGFFLMASDWSFTVAATVAACSVVNTAIGILGRLRQKHKTDLSQVGWPTATTFYLFLIAYIIGLTVAVTLRLAGGS